MKILVIDDFAFIATGIRQCLNEDEVDHLYRIPDDLSKLDEYDVLVVDNQGIGNKQFSSGSNFLEHYNPVKQQLVIYHSGLAPEHEFSLTLQRKGFTYFVKGSRPDEFIKLVNSWREGM